ncbi:MAG: bifunctional 4-hydroxy-2-oxoglutarate aldolase/2-dehydro-3-deoxy-phosphogluconate aldolase [Clostridia bacterium]|nr:bifunctional 4-hydroxy-2-oxoglutarate aldolase/2-dehydro-3-deoxy-phosphogluconate aldolase [Clostridia bacterium]
MSDLSTKLGNIGLIPVVVFDKVEYALPTAKAMIEGGLPVMEVTLRTDAAIESMQLIKKNYPEIILGAGTVLNVKQAKAAVEAGCEFIVSPGFDDGVVRYCLNNDILVTPGCVTPTEITHALEFGLNILKFFPASIYGGLPACKALHGPFRMVKFVPTGGIDLSNLSEYADKDFIHAIGGGWLCSANDMAEGRYSNITDTIRKSIDVLLGFEIAHIGINMENEEVSLELAAEVSKAFGMALKQGNSSNFVGTQFEVMKTPFKGKNGHIAVRTNNIDRALYYLDKRGYKADISSTVEKNGKKTAVYLENEFGGFAVHLIQK